jgi:ABC-2 type transport system permease protein
MTSIQLREELRLLASRGSARAALAGSVLAGIAAVVAVAAWRRMAPEVPDGVMALPRGSGVTAAGWALSLRNFFVLPLLLAHATAASLAGDGADRTLREVLLAPVGRARVLLVRLVAIGVLAATCTVLTLLTSLLPAALAFGTGEPVGRLLLGYLASAASDVGLLAAAACLALWVRSTTGSVLALAFALAVDLAVRGALRAAGGLASMGVASGLASAQALVPYTFGAALAGWEGWEGGFEAGPFVGLVAWTTAFTLLAVSRIRHTEMA